MAKDNPTDQKSEKVQIAKISAFQAIIAALIAAIATAIPVYFATKQMGSGTTTPVTPEETAKLSVQLIDSEDLPKRIKEAQFRVFAAGYALDRIDPQVLADKIREKKGFQVRIVMVDPTSQVICQRNVDEGSKNPGYEKITNQIKRINSHRKEFSEQDYSVKLSNRYPMMAVYIIDNDVYAHFYPYAAPGSSSPVLKLDQKDTKNAAFFMDHFNKIFGDAQWLPNVEYKPGKPCTNTKT